MKIKFEHNGTAFEYQTRPMRKSYFRALCGLAAGGLYAGLTLGIAALCGLPGLIVVGVVSFFVSMLVILTD